MLEAIIFDFGNVIIDLDFERSFSSFEQLLQKDWRREIPADIQRAVEAYEIGEISDETFLWRFQQYNPSVGPRALMRAWNSLIGEIHPSSIEMLARLKKDYNLYILSNINAFHLDAVTRYLQSLGGIQKFESNFSKVFYSHLVGLRKPDAQIYCYVSDELKLERDKVLFIDDREENVRAALEHGWHAVQHEPTKNIADVIDGYIQSVRGGL